MKRTSSVRAFLIRRLSTSALLLLTPPAAHMFLKCSSALKTFSCNIMRSLSSSICARHLRTIDAADGSPSESSSDASDAKKHFKDSHNKKYINLYATNLHAQTVGHLHPHHARCHPRNHRHRLHHPHRHPPHPPPHQNHQDH